MKQYVFYPMITSTLKTLLTVAEPDDALTCLEILTTYPKYKLDGDSAAKPLVLAVLDELDRQYARWNHGGTNNGQE